MIRFVRAYFVRGAAPNYWKHKYEITDPPTSGYGHVVVIPGDKRSTLFCANTLVAYQVNNRCGELASAIDVEVAPERLAELINRSWAEAVHLGFQRDFGVAAMVLTELGQPVPKFIPPPVDPSKGEEVKRGGKPVVESALKPCRQASKRGEVATFFLREEPQSLHEAMAKLGLTRSGVLSHLFTLNRDHGVGYELVSDCARLLVPEGFDLFAYVEPIKPDKPDKPEKSASGAPKRRGGGKPINPDALKPIPEPGKRATVARLFIDGWHNMAEAMTTLDLDRSAVLSHLFTINKENGLGYELSEDGVQARLLVPEGHESFGTKQPRVKKPVEE